MLRSPVHRVLRDRIDEHAIVRVWNGIQNRRRRSRVSWSDLVITAALVIAVTLGGLFLVQLVQRSAWPPSTPEHSTSRLTVHESVTPLSLSDGTPLRVINVPAGGTATTEALSDGSRLTFEPGARWEPLASTDGQFVSSLRDGSMRFSVKTGGTRRWLVQAGPVSVEVVGTEFVVSRDPVKVVVSVERGAVLVRGEPVPDKVQRLSAGQRMEVSISPARDSAQPDEVQLSGVREQTPAWLARARQGDFAGAYANLGATGVEREASETRALDRLLTLADVARLSGHPADAIAPLQQIVRQHAARPEAGLAAVTLGRLLLDQLGRPDEAAEVLSRALSMNVPAGLREDVYARLVEAHARAGRRALAEDAVRRYQREFPEGQRRRELSRWIEGP